VTQHRLREKTFLQTQGFPVTPFRAIRSEDDLRQAVRDLGLPAVLKTASFGYDGKGQRKIRSESEIPEAFAGLRGVEGIFEAYVDFEKEVSVVAARTLDGGFEAFPVFENRHENHILDLTFAPAAIPPELTREAIQLARGILEALKVVGLLTVELFVTRSGRLLVNELAPRTHNSGHLTLDVATTCQFEQQVRAVCGLPLGSPRLKSPAAMANLLGDRWTSGTPDWASALRDPDVKLHLYGKREARAGRKMGHYTVLADTLDEALAQALQILAYCLRREALRPGPAVRGDRSAPEETAAPGPATEPAEDATQLADQRAVQGFFEHLERSLLAIGFLDPAHPKKLMPRLRRLFVRARLRTEEVDLLRGICKLMERTDRR
jgi:5-(carboxyamino)imidazole ribonucleotide synthase